MNYMVMIRQLPRLLYRIMPPALLVVASLASCGGDRTSVGNDYLLKIGDHRITQMDYEEALEIATTAYPYESLQDEETLKGIKSRLLKQLTEELILSERARELGLTVSAAELQEAVDVIKADYPEGAFEQTLFENAVSFQAWKKRLAARLLMEKVIRRELMEKVEVTPAAVQEYYERQHDGADNDQLNPQHNVMIVKRLRREKARQQYPDWVKHIQRDYRVELNTAMWERLLQ